MARMFSGPKRKGEMSQPPQTGIWETQTAGTQGARENPFAGPKKTACPLVGTALEIRAPPMLTRALGPFFDSGLKTTAAVFRPDGLSPGGGRRAPPIKNQLVG